MNGHDWLKHKLTANGISFTKHDHVFLRMDDLEGALKNIDKESIGLLVEPGKSKMQSGGRVAKFQNREFTYHSGGVQD